MVILGDSLPSFMNLYSLRRFGTKIPVASLTKIAVSLCAAVGLTTLNAKAADPAELPAAMEKQATARAAISTEFEGRLKLVKGWYTTSLDTLQQDATAKGNLDTLLGIKKERERAERALTAEEMAELKEPLLGLRGRYDQALETLATQQKAREATAVRDYVASLEALEKRITQRGDIDGALKVREEVGKARSEAAALETKRTAPDPQVAAVTPAAPGSQPVTASPGATPAPKPATPANSATAAKSGGATSHPALIGSWHFKWTETGFEQDFTFAADGTFSSGGKDVGTWRVDGDKIIMDTPGGAPKTIFLPIKPSGTKVIDQRKNRNVEAVKLKG